MITLPTSWQSILQEETQKDYFKVLMQNVEKEYASSICYPSKELIFNALQYSSFEDIKVVILGQDPYHGEGEANGLCFSVNDGVKIPPSLRNIYKEIATDLNTIFMPISGNLEHWAKQGVLLLNSTLTVQKNKANSHKHLKWNVFTDAIIQKISEQKQNVVFLLWGAFAQQKSKYIDSNKHLILECGHPSFAQSHKKWFGNKHFSQTNKYLIENNKQPIKW